MKEINSEVKITLLKSKRLLPKHSGVGYLSIPIKQFQDGNIHEGNLSIFYYHYNYHIDYRFPL